MSKIVNWEDEFGRQQASLLPDHVPDSEAPKGVNMLRIEVDELDLPEPAATRLHNQLVARRLWDWPAVKKRGGANVLFGALQAALKIDVVKLTNLYRRE